MGTRGRKSSAELTAPAAVALIERPDAPDALTYEEQETWRAIVEPMPADWFRPEAFPVLTQLVRHTVAARRVSELIHQEENTSGTFDPDYYLRLLRCLAQQSAAIGNLSVKLRLTPQSRYTPQGAGTRTRGVAKRKPWEAA